MSQTRRASARGYASILAAVALVAATAPLVAQTDAPKRTHDIVVEDYFSLALVSSVHPSPDGSRVAYTELRWQPPAQTRNRDIWVVDVATRARRRLTFDRAADVVLGWSKDGESIYFTSARRRAGATQPPYDGKTQLWRVDAAGGAPIAVTHVNGGIGRARLSDDRQTLYHMRAVPTTHGAFAEMKQLYSLLQYGHGVDRFGAIWKTDLRTWRTSEVVAMERVIIDYAVAPDESRIAMISAPDANLITFEGESTIDVYDVGTKETKRLDDDLWRKKAPSPFGWLSGVTWSPDSKALVFDVSFDGYPTEVFCAEWGGSGVYTHKLERADEIHVTAGHYAWRGTGRTLAFVAEHRAGARVYEVANVSGTGQGATAAVTPDGCTVQDFGYAGGRLFAVWATRTDTPNVYAADGTRLSDANPHVRTWRLPTIKKVTWTGADGVPVEGILELPHDADPDQALPLVVEIHGGPTAASQDRLRFWIYGRTLLPARGYAVLSPNYRGSTGYGDKFMTDLVRRENDVEVKDILAGVDAMVERGIADPKRLGVMGWSNGGLLTNCLIGQTTRFKAASSGAGVIDMAMQWGLEDTPGHVVNFMGAKLPWEDPAEYRESSPLYNLDKVVTPTLIHVGAKDARCPPGHSRTLYRALRHYLQVPTELIVYPGEPHGLTKYRHRLAKMKWDLAWFERWLGPGR